MQGDFSNSIGDHLRKDRLVWPMTRNDVYTVRSGYHWVNSSTVHVVTRPISTSFSIPSQVWKVIWKLKTPSKIRCFCGRHLVGRWLLWRLFLDVDVLLLRYALSFILVRNLWSICFCYARGWKPFGLEVLLIIKWILHLCRVGFLH